jgi:DNA-binding transcriptional MerR regulator
VKPISDPEFDALTFDEQAIYMLRKIEFLRTAHGVNLAGIKIIFDLMHELRQMESEMRFHQFY